MDNIIVTPYLNDQQDFASDFQSPQSNHFDGSPNQGSPFDTFEFGQDVHQFPHTPSYNGSYQNSPYSTYSDLPPFDGPDDAFKLFSESRSSALIPDEYDPRDFDVPNAGGLLLDDGFMSGLPGQPQISVTPYDHKSALFDRGSPASSAGADDDAHSHASNSSFGAHPGSPSMDFASNFQGMSMRSPNWPNGPLPALDRSTPPDAHKPPSPPQLLIPDNATSPSVSGVDSPPMINAPDGDGMSAGPQLHIVPATPVSGGGNAGPAVRFQGALGSMHPGQSQQADSASWDPAALGASQGLDTSQFPDQPFAYGGSSNPQGASSGMGFGAESLPQHGGAGHQQFLLPQGMHQRSRSLSDTSLRPPMWDSPMMNLNQASAGGDGSGFGSHDGRRLDATVNMNDVLPGPSSSPLLSSLSPSLRQPSSAGPHTTSFGMPRLSQQFNFGPGTTATSLMAPQQDFLSPDGGAALRRAKSDGARGHRAVRSEDLRYSNALLAPGSPMLYPPPSSAQQDFIRSSRQFLHPAAAAEQPVAITRGHHRRSSSGSRERPPGLGGWSSGASSARASPYPSPSASPRPGYGALPGEGALRMGMGMGGGDMGLGGLSMSPPADVAITVSKVNVTTPSTADASHKRRKQPANFTCPIPGCGSTFTRHFNLKGHMRSHADEKPFLCKWPGCNKGFARQHDCKRHEQLHLNIRPYPCEGCKKNFARMDALNRHLRSEGGAECRKVQEELTPASVQAQVGLKAEPDWISQSVVV